MKKFSILILLLFVGSVKAAPQESTLYFGADGQYCKMCFKHNFGDNLYKKKSLGVNPFIGVHIKDTPFAIEAGYQYCESTRTSTLMANEYASGTQIPEIAEPVTFRSSLRMKGPHANILVLTPRFDEYPIQFFFGVGISSTKASFERRTIQMNYLTGKINRKMGTSRSLRRLTLGANYFFREDIAIRATWVFMNTDKLHAFANDGILGHSIPEVRPKNSSYYGLGLRFSF